MRAKYAPAPITSPAKARSGASSVGSSVIWIGADRRRAEVGPPARSRRRQIRKLEQPRPVGVRRPPSRAVWHAGQPRVVRSPWSRWTESPCPHRHTGSWTGRRKRRPSPLEEARRRSTRVSICRWNLHGACRSPSERPDERAGSCVLRRTEWNPGLHPSARVEHSRDRRFRRGPAIAHGVVRMHRTCQHVPRPTTRR